jgi:hypothetical protein
VQCARMLEHTPDCYVWLFLSEAIRIVPAISVVAGDNEPVLLYYRGVRRFFEEHFASFIGDGAISVPRATGLFQLSELGARYGVHRGLYLGATSS